MTEVERIYYCPICSAQIMDFIWFKRGKYYCSSQHAKASGA